MVRIAALAAGLAITTVLAATPAVASESGYLIRLERANITIISPEDALHWGTAACDSLRAGAPPAETISMLRNVAGFRPRHAGQLLGAAVAELCPDQYQDVMDWAHAQIGR
ncbi:DUF732 domain-containing protein [Mycobacterium sp.]|uniref:DUF732 domain-containing protein n=1 Tax=Mycobacterium sp. TaxID=1785 RepID=UPI001289003F|nr:DUF732 domain-containing protein [Mycobacterium sp.]KAA8957422.1 MAG: DUF732 domain-containing protein [Mycobacterium sp.]